MTLRVDKAGRVVLPKPVRDRLGLQAGSDLELEETSEGVVLKPIGRRPSLVKKGSFLVHTGEVPPGFDITRAIDDDREERDSQGVGLVKWYFDTSVLVAAAVVHHPHNARALTVLEEMIRRKHRGYIGAHGLSEVYSVLTRTPFKPPLYPTEAWQIIETMILPHMELVVLTPKEYTDVVSRCATNGWSGGRVHDAVHLRCALKAVCDQIYTFNVKDFQTMALSSQVERIAAP